MILIAVLAIPAALVISFFASTGELRRLFFAAIMMCVTLPAVFLTVFVLPLIHSHDGQAGIGATFVGIPVSALVALIAGPASYVLSIKWGWFQPPKD